MAQVIARVVFTQTTQSMPNLAFCRDDLKTERQLSEATLALQTSRDIAVALVVASLMMGSALAWRLWGQKGNR